MTTSPLTVLIVEDDPDVRLGCEQALRLEGIATRAAGSAEAALREAGAGFAGVVVSDIRLPGMDGMALLRALRARDATLPVVMVTGHGDVSLAVQAMKDGAYDFLEKPFSPEQLVEVARRALEQRRLVLEVADLRRRLAGRDTLEARLTGHSPAIERLRRLIADLADTAANVLIHGETGTGKELVARSLHALSTRHQAPFVALNCGAVPEAIFESEMFGHEAGAFTGAGKRRVGKLEHASGGTLFLDEIESMPLALQVKLLRVLQEGTLERLGSNASIGIDVRIVAAAKGDMETLVANGTFRQDLLYRLNVVTIPLPPLRERREDIVPLFEHFMLVAAVRYQRPAPILSELQRQALMQRAWPGNVRELRNAADRLVLGVPEGGARADAPDDSTPLKERMEHYERAVIADTLARTGGAVSQAADLLQVGKATLYEKIKRYGL